mmetsp:Transcript_12767/g.17853  ORF Transcript_12767/g.17853 Transcript_12767/m.17853 type:complete len:284 (+) Transcript_12767:153-1004(+)
MQPLLCVTLALLATASTASSSSECLRKMAEKINARRIAGLRGGRGSQGGDIFTFPEKSIYGVEVEEEEADKEDVDESTEYFELPAGLDLMRNISAHVEWEEKGRQRRWKHDIDGYLAPFPLVEPPKSGFVKKILREGYGPSPKIGMGATVHATGFGKDGNINKKFWSSHDGGDTAKPFHVEVGTRQVIAAFDEVLMTMKVGEKACIVVAPDYAYGKEGFPDWGVQPDSPVKFEIELLDIHGGFLTTWHINKQLRSKKKPFRWKMRAPGYDSKQLWHPNNKEYW